MYRLFFRAVSVALLIVLTIVGMGFNGSWPSSHIPVMRDAVARVVGEIRTK